MFLILLTVFNINSLYATDWNEIYKANTGLEKHAKIVLLANQDDGKAQFILSHHYRLGEFVSKDWKKADKWLFDSANNGYAEAEYMLGSSYNSSKYNFPIDNEKAVMWLERAAKHGHIDAQYELGEHYHVGLGIKKDLILSYLWLRLASRHGGFVATRSSHIVENEMTVEQLKKAKRQVPAYFEKYVKQIKIPTP